MACMADSTFSRRTNDRDYRAVVRVLFELLHTPQLYHQRGVQRQRLERINRAVVATDATNLTLTRSVAIPSEIHEEDVLHEIQPTDGGLKLNLAARVDEEYKHPLGVTVTAGETREPTQFDHLQSDVEVLSGATDGRAWTYAFFSWSSVADFFITASKIIDLLYSRSGFCVGALVVVSLR
jgi:hypothetical protein